MQRGSGVPATRSSTEIDAEPAIRGEGTDSAPVDAWILGGLPGPLKFATYLTITGAAQYRLIVDVLLAAQSRSLTGVARTDLPRLLIEYAAQHIGEQNARPLLEELLPVLDARMEQLHQWRTVDAWHDRAEKEADFLRNRDRYQLTVEAAQLHRFVVEQERKGEEAPTSSLIAPALIADNLRGFLAAAAADDFDSAAKAWATVALSLEHMQGAAHRWQSAMASGLSGAPTAEKIQALTSLLQNYIEVWGASVDMYTPAIAEHTAKAAGIGADTWRAVALPQVGAGAGEELVSRAVAEMAEMLATLQSWFTGADSEARRLRRQVRDAVPDLLRSHRTLLAIGGAVSRRAEVLALAGDIERADNDAAAWQIWCRATGLYAPRHLAVAGPENTATSRTSFWDAPPAPVDRKLRTKGHRALRGAAGKIPDLSGARAAARRDAAGARKELAAAESGVLRRSGQPLSQWGDLTEAEGALLWDLLSTARAGARGEDGSRTGVSVDGRWQVRMSPAKPGTCSALLRLPQGVMAIEDVTVEVLAQ